jgi:hypothetical protein
MNPAQKGRPELSPNVPSNCGRALTSTGSVSRSRISD